MSDERDRTGAEDDRTGVARDPTDATEPRGETDGSDADRTTDESDAARTADETEPMTHEHEQSRDRTETTTDAAADESDFHRIRRYVQYATLGALVLLGVIALIQFYISASNAISTWIEPEYRNVFRMAFNLVILLLVGAGISWQLRRMRSEE